MIVEVRMKDGDHKKFCKSVFVGVLGSRKDSLYIQTRARRNVIETFIPLTEIECYNVREPR